MGVHVGHLYLPGHALLFQEGCHHQKRVARNEPIGPAVGVAIEIHRLPQWRVLFWTREKLQLLGMFCGTPLTHCVDNGQGLDALMDVQGDNGHIERCPLGFPRPEQLRIKVRVVREGALAACHRIGFGVTSPTGGLFSRCLSLC